jgi:predicted metalloprotease with PDZ domain
VWIPGSYLVREFSKHLQNLRLPPGQTHAHHNPVGQGKLAGDAHAGEPLTVQYEVYAFDNSVRTAWLDATRGFSTAPACACRWTGKHQTSPMCWNWLLQNQ